MLFPKKILILSILFGLLYLAFGVLDLKYYGPNWDESVHFGRGQAILHYLINGKKDYKETPAILRRSSYKNNSYTYIFFEEKFREGRVPIIGAGHPPLSDALAAFSNVIFYEKLNILGDIESYHLYSVLLSSLLIGYIFYFVTREYGLFAGTISALSLFFYPLFLGESRFNIKDIPQACFYAFTALFFYKGITTNQTRWIFLSALAFSFGFATKFNILFLPFTLTSWLLLFYVTPLRKNGFKKFFVRHVKILASFLLYPILSLTIFFLSWPLLWEDPVRRFLYNFSYYKIVGLQGPTHESFYTIFDINTYATQWILFTTPLVILLLSSFGFLYSFTKGRHEKNKLALFILLLFLIPILRVTVPNVIIYGGVRQIMEYIPAMAIIAGIGAGYIVTLLHGYIVTLIKKIHKKQLSNAAMKQLVTAINIIIFLSFIPIAFKIWQMHPNESIYFNPIIGGLKGASERNIPGWGNSLGSTYRQGVGWINEHAKPGAKLGFVFELRSNIRDLDLRRDIALDNQIRSGLARKGEYIIGVTHEGTYEESFHRKYLERFLIPVYEVKVDDISVLKVWKNDFEHTKPQYQKVPEKHKEISLKKENNALIVDLNKNVRITKIEIHYKMDKCKVPENGYFEYSATGKKWNRTVGDFTFFPLSVHTKTRPTPGILQFWFPAEQARYIQLVIHDKESCLLLHPIDVGVYRL